MKRRTRTLLIAGTTVALMTSGLVASALWSTGVDVDVPAVALGAVRFGATSETATGDRAFSAAGEPVTVTLPGARVIEVLDQTSIDADPVIWRFTASGAALGITGLRYDVAVTEQVTSEGSFDLSSGHAQPGSVLERATLKVYRAGAGSDCSAFPETPPVEEGETARNVYVYDATDVELQAPGSAPDGTESVQEWCAAIDWNDVDDGIYINEVQVTGWAEDGSANGAVDRWHSQVGFPPALELLGVYRNLARVEALAEDTTTARASDAWEVDVYPDPSGEPDIVISLDPIITNLNPAIDPSD